jgi:hypothetical protein
MIASITLVLESLTKRQCEIVFANNILLKFQKDMISVGNKIQARKFFYPVFIAEPVRKGAVKKAATKVDVDNRVLI